MANATGTKMTKRSRPKQHSRRLPSGRSITINKGVRKRKVYKANKYTKIRKRPLGTKISYKDVGRMQTAFDEYGNFRGSRIIKSDIAKDPKATTAQITAEEIKILETKYYNREIDSETYHNKLNKILSTR